ncbi:hypothetical protein F183_A45680 [Bryobacterales bacterium F-183]|nr:hypothetical protein F183_A45680 [Bryobacterales bacterium F-183]
MSIWSRITNVFRNREAELDAELQAHLEEALENGRSAEDARRAFGSPLRMREEMREAQLAVWLDTLKADCVFGWRQLAKNPVVSAAAVLSLALAIGASTAAFRLFDAILLRPLPVANPERLYVVEREFIRNGQAGRDDTFEYPMFREVRAAAKDEAELIAISYASYIDITYGSDREVEKARRQHVSGWMFGVFGLKPALGRLLTESDDHKPDAHPYAVLSYDYWIRRFGGDPNVLGKKFRQGGKQFEIVGVCERGFRGTETGADTDFFVPMMMNGRAIENPNWGWFRAWAAVRPGASLTVLRDKIQAAHQAHRAERVKSWQPGQTQEEKDRYIKAPVVLDSASAGVSGLQRDYRQPLIILAVVVLLVLLIACANVANLLTAQASARAREMALRVSIGAGGARLLQLVLVESAIVAVLASAAGTLFAWWAAPFVVSMISDPSNPTTVYMPADWRVFLFAAILALAVTFLFGLLPALRAAGVKPMAVLRGSESPKSRRRVIHVLTAVQMAFCVLVLFIAGLFFATFERISAQPMGFRADHLLLLEGSSKVEQQHQVWQQVLPRLREVAGVEAATLAGWPLMSGNGWTSRVWVGGRVRSEGVEPYFLSVGPRWVETMGMRLIDGREFRMDESTPSVAIVNEEFAKRYFDGQNPVGRTFEQMDEANKLQPIRIVGYVGDAKYRDMREAVRPTVYLPFRSRNEKQEEGKTDWATYVVRVQPSAPAQITARLRDEVAQARPELRIGDVTTQEALIRSHTVRERLLAALSSFFAVVALVLASVGLFGVLTYSMTQRRKEIGIRLALGAPARSIAIRVTAESFTMLVLGAVGGLLLGTACAAYIESLLFGVKADDLGILLTPALTLAAAALLAAIPPVVRAVRIDPSYLLRTE